jgi:micrococcal nuclease
MVCVRWIPHGYATHTRPSLLAAIAIFLLAGMACDDLNAAPRSETAANTLHTCTTSHQPFPPGEAVFCADPAPMESARVVRVVDGDTIRVNLAGREETVRFYGIDTTERGEPCFSEASRRTAELVGPEVRLRRDVRERDRYGRLLRYVYTPTGLSIGAEMISEGLAHAWRADGALRVPLIALEEAARASATGCLWD